MRQRNTSQISIAKISVLKPSCHEVAFSPFKTKHYRNIRPGRKLAVQVKQRKMWLVARATVSNTAVLRIGGHAHEKLNEAENTGQAVVLGLIIFTSQLISLLKQRLA